MPLVLAVALQMPATAAPVAGDRVHQVGLLRALPVPVVVRPAVGADLVAERVVLAQRAVQQGQLPQLRPTQVVLVLGQFDRLSDDLVDLLGGGDDAGLGRRCQERMQRLVLARQRLAVLPADLALFDRALTADYDLGASLRAVNNEKFGLVEILDSSANF